MVYKTKSIGHPYLGAVSVRTILRWCDKLCTTNKREKIEQMAIETSDEMVWSSLKCQLSHQLYGRSTCSRFAASIAASCVHRGCTHVGHVSTVGLWPRWWYREVDHSQDLLAGVSGCHSVVIQLHSKYTARAKLWLLAHTGVASFALWHIRMCGVSAIRKNDVTLDVDDVTTSRKCSFA